MSVHSACSVAHVIKAEFTVMLWLAKRRKRNVRCRKNVCVVIETLKTGHISTKNVNKSEIKYKATHERTQHNAKKLVYRHLHHHHQCCRFW